jgi:lysophospholipase L1-like esterase
VTGPGARVEVVNPTPSLLAAAALAVAGAVVAAIAPVQAAQAAGSSYVALGDSYSAGNGTGSTIDDGTDCERSTLAYPSLLAAQNGWSLDFRACSGATIPDVQGSQLSALGTGTSYVTISIGGNDAGFADVLTECALPAWASDCDGAIDGAVAYIDDTLPGTLSALYDQIAADAPNADVAVVGYPRIFMGEDCNAATFFSPEEEQRLNDTADLINSTISAQASSHGFAFANPTSAFIGHAVCDDPEWINGLSSPISDSYHPNATGHASGYAPIVGAALGTSFAPSAATTQAAKAQGDALAAADAPATGSATQFRAPNLHAAEVEKAAQAHGIDLDHWIAAHR